MRAKEARNLTDTDDGSYWLQHEMVARKQGFTTIAGIDEAGRGPLAGPVTAAACILPPKLLLPNINDSKKLTPPQRQNLFDLITSNPAITYAIATISPSIIDEINILQATIQAMLAAVAKLPTTPDCLLVDGLTLPHPTIPCKKIIKGDTQSQSIAAASILAKVTRDQLMIKCHEKYPQYGFEKHKGYGVPAHLQALQEHGPCAIHRMSFEPVRLAEAGEAGAPPPHPRQGGVAPLHPR